MERTRFGHTQGSAGKILPNSEALGWDSPSPMEKGSHGIGTGTLALRVPGSGSRCCPKPNGSSLIPPRACYCRCAGQHRGTPRHRVFAKSFPSPGSLEPCKVCTPPRALRIIYFQHCSTLPGALPQINPSCPEFPPTNPQAVHGAEPCSSSVHRGLINGKRGLGICSEMGHIGLQMLRAPAGFLPPAPGHFVVT